QKYHHWSVESLVELPADQIWVEYILKDFPQVHSQLKPIAEDLMFYIDTHFFKRELRPEMPAALAQIKAMGLKIGIISNIPSLKQVPYNLEQYGILQFFDPIVLSSEYRRRKPDPSIFYYAARLAKTPTSECAFVGDRIARDIEGAYRAGYGYRVQIRHGFDSGEKDDGADPDAVIDNMLELVDLLHAQNQKKEPVNNHNHKPNKKLKALFFDAGDLLYHRPNEGKSLEKWLKSLNIYPTSIDPSLQAELKEMAFCNLISRYEYHVRLIRSLGINDETLIQCGVEILQQEDDDITIFKGVPETMRALKEAGFFLGIITDTALPVSTKLNWFERAGFGNVWDAVISSAEVGFRKPDPRIYQAGVDQIGVDFAQAGFVGHKKSELDGAHAMGMPTIAFNPDPDAQADFRIEKFENLLNLAIVRGES
ncbi:HAD family hydrolase, partial [bacterium]|nr:HAD family hydrolase [bacterium]